MLAAASRVSERAATGFAVAGLVVLIAFALATLVNGVARAAFDSPFDLVSDGAPLFVAASVVSCVPLAILHRANITIHLLVLGLPTGAGQVVRTLTDSLVLVVLAAVTRQLAVYAASSARAGDSTAMLDIPTAPVWAYAAVMLGLATVIQAQLILGEIVSARAGRPVLLPGPHH